MRKRNKIKFQIGRQSVRAIIGLIFGVLSIILTTALIILSIKSGGEISTGLAIVAVIVNLISIAGFILALLALYIKDVRTTIPIIALILNGITVLVYIIIYIFGLGGAV